MKKLFKPQNEMWVATRENLVNTILYIVKNKPTDAKAGYIEDKLYYLLEDYGVYRKVYKKEKSKPIFRLTAPLFYIAGIILFIILRPITYIFGVDIVNTKLGYFMRAWEARI